MPEKKSAIYGVARSIWTWIVALAALVGLFSVSILDVPDRLLPKTYAILVPVYTTAEEYQTFMRAESLKDALQLKPYAREISEEFRKAVELAKTRWEASERASDLAARTVFLFFPEGVGDRDSGTYQSAFDHALTLAKRANAKVAGAIGHVTSTATEIYAPLYARENLSLILPLATATSLMDTLASRGVEAIRLVPNNRRQAESLARFLLNGGQPRPVSLAARERWPRAVVVADMSNPAYSTDLLREFRDQFCRSPLVNAKEWDAPHGQILASIPAGSPGVPALAAADLQSLRPDALVVLGMTEVALESLAQAEAAGLKARFTLMTDGAIDDYLLQRIHAIQRSAPSGADPCDDGLAKELESKSAGEAPDSSELVPGAGRLILSFPMSETDRQTLQTLDLSPRYEMSHSLYVMDAATLMLAALDDYESGYPILRGTPRRSIRRWIRSQKTRGAPVPVDLQNNYIFTPRGESSTGCYHLWEIANGETGMNLSWTLVSEEQCHSDEVRRLAAVR